MKQVVLDGIESGDLVNCSGFFIDRTNADALDLDYFNYAGEELLAHMYIKVNFNAFSEAHVFLMSKESISDIAASLSELPNVDRTYVCASGRYLQQWVQGEQVGETLNLDHFYTGLTKCDLELTRI